MATITIRYKEKPSTISSTAYITSAYLEDRGEGFADLVTYEDGLPSRFTSGYVSFLHNTTNDRDRRPEYYRIELLPEQRILGEKERVPVENFHFRIKKFVNKNHIPSRFNVGMLHYNSLDDDYPTELVNIIVHDYGYG